ncbi:hypothetical protein B0H14DRAFT_1708762 [Mycena olivaceomarginata]|nr:hypothetical protein B0H14DRAFT_1708762 [Mycena olivaceomarginata]
MRVGVGVGVGTREDKRSVRRHPWSRVAIVQRFLVPDPPPHRWRPRRVGISRPGPRAASESSASCSPQATPAPSAPPNAPPNAPPGRERSARFAPSLPRAQARRVLRDVRQPVWVPCDFELIGTIARRVGNGDGHIWIRNTIAALSTKREARGGQARARLELGTLRVSLFKSSSDTDPPETSPASGRKSENQACKGSVGILDHSLQAELDLSRGRSCSSWQENLAECFSLRGLLERR